METKRESLLIKIGVVLLSVGLALGACGDGGEDNGGDGGGDRTTVTTGDDGFDPGY